MFFRLKTFSGRTGRGPVRADLGCRNRKNLRVHRKDAFPHPHDDRPPAFLYSLPPAELMGSRPIATGEPDLSPQVSRQIPIHRYRFHPGGSRPLWF